MRIVKSTKRRTGKTQIDYERGTRDGDALARSIPLAELANGPLRIIVQGKHDKRQPWNSARYESTMAEHLRSQGMHYANGYCDAVKRHHDIAYKIRNHLRSTWGFHDGCRWAAEFGTPEQQSEMVRAIEIYDGVPPHLNEEYDVFSWTEAHALLVHLFGGKYPTEKLSECPELEGRGGPILDPVFDCPQFREFWSPFISETMDECMEMLKGSIMIEHKLNDRSYIRGFVLGAVASHLQLTGVRQLESQ